MKNLYEIQPCETHALYYDDIGRTSDKSIDLVDLTSKVNESAVFSILQFGAIIPPLSPWEGIKRLLPGNKYLGNNHIGPIELSKFNNISLLNPKQQSVIIENILDIVLKRLIGDQQDPVLLFSGGVDSGLIASRLAVLGYRNTLLLNYSFGEEDHESKLAEEMAKHLGLRFERFYSKSNLCDCLINPGQVYPQPFGDQSTVPTSDFANSVKNHLIGQNRLILDGTGADGGFGMKNKIKTWELVLRVPAIIKHLASVVYDPILWQRSGKLEYLSRILRRSKDMPLLSGVLALNPLSGIFYYDHWRHSVDSLLDDWIGSWAGKLPSQQIVAADLALICSNIYAQKAQSILESSGHKVSYPFLETEIVSLAIASIPYWQMDEPKAPLKRSLAKYVPHKMVYRPKSGFDDPHGHIFFDSGFIAYLRAAAESSSPIASILKIKPLLKACDLLFHRRKLPYQTLNCLWAITFTDRWYRTVRYKS